MSERAKVADPNNWKAYASIADLSSKMAAYEPQDTDDAILKQLIVHRKAVDECLKALTLPDADKGSIENILLPIYNRIAMTTMDKDEAVKCLSSSIEIKEDID